MVPLKYFSNFWRTLEMNLSNCEINLTFTWSANCVIVYTNKADHVTVCYSSYTLCYGSYFINSE